MSRQLVISPSGNFYGSEQVLFDYLQNTQMRLDVSVPANSLFLAKLEEAKMKHRIRQYNEKNLPAFYAKVYRQLLTGKYNLVYLNEAGHIKYLILLARIFRKKKFIVHVRLLEDTYGERWKNGITDNMTILAISKYISEKLPVKNLLIYDAYAFSNKNQGIKSDTKDILRIAIIGRITKTKGIGLLPGLLEKIHQDGSEGKFIFELYGEVSDDISKDEILVALRKSTSVVFKGFEKNNKLIYRTVDCILHLSMQEPLGRIFFEALDHYKPLVGFRAAGMGEIAEMLELNHWLADPDSPDPAAEIYRLLKDIRVNYQRRVCEAEQKKNLAIQLFNPAIYRDRVDKLLSA